MNNYKLGSLFDGSGGFPLAGALCGIEPIWASEVEPYPIAVTKSRFPKLKHLGDISKINGAEIEPVDIITFGSPCQDLSVAGKRAGLKHEANGDDETTRSGLFMEAVRIIKEMREKTNGKYPRFAIWENVPGAFSSNKGEDFKVVLEELIKIIEPTATMPSVPQKGWNYADSYCGDGWSLAYRVLDAQYWGVPQRRRRIYLVADFRGECAREILFEREGLRGYFTKGRTPWQRTTTDAQGSTGADDREGEIPYTLKIRSGCEGGGKGALIQKDKSATLATNNDQYLFQPTGRNGVIAIDKESFTSGVGFDRAPGIKIGGPCATLQTNGVHAVCYDARGNGDGLKSNTITGDHENRVTDYTSVVLEPQPTYCLQGNGIDRAETAGCNGKGWNEDTSYTLNTIDRPAVAYSFDSLASNSMKSKNPHSGCRETEVAKTLDTTDPNPSKNQGGIAVVQPVYNASKASFFTRASKDGPADTLVATDYKDPQLVAYGFDPSASRDVGALFIEECGKTLTNGTCPGHHDGVVIAKPLGIGIQSSQGIDKIGEDLSPTLINGSNPGWQNGVMTTKPQYIVRRLTPTECARLQGFADRWGEVDAVDKLSQKDYQFWLEVRRTYDAINGREPKDYTVKQMLTWYNKLQTDSAEYKMWGNGIALPTALYVLQGVADALSWEEYEI